jgi:glutamate synthase (NADPH/NADH) large chain
MRLPKRWGLYEPSTEHDACGVGFVAHIKGEKSRAIVDQGLEVLDRLSHRAATGADPETGDGAGILIQIPHRFFKRVGLELGFDMPRRRRYAVGMVFLPADPRQRAACEEVVAEVIAEESQRLIGWRDVPVEPEHLGRIARGVVPVIRQIYVARRRVPPSAFERRLFVIRKLIENRIRERGLDPDGRFHIASLSAETIVYKGLLLPRQVPAFYPDLREPDMVSAIGLVHSRFSTNTFPTWDLAQPFRFSCHNGEINTLRGNRNWMRARRSVLQSAYFGGNLERLHPIVVAGRSDSAQFDNMLELLHLGGRSLAHSMMMMIPEAWEHDAAMDPERRDFYRYSSSLLEPWDGPAAICFTDGLRIGATLDRNGLRPARYLITEDDRIILASETGVIDVPTRDIRFKGRLTPGKMLLVDTEEGRVVSDDEIKREIAHRWPYGRWLATNVYDVDMDQTAYTGYNIPPFADVPGAARTTGEALRQQQRCFGYTDETERILLGPMAESGKEPVGSMGADTPLACLSERAPSLFAYFHQLFAQVTNPPIDPIRESLVMTVDTTIGPDGNTFEETPEHCHKLRLDGPILGNEKLAKIAAIHEGVFEPIKLNALWTVADGPDALEQALERLCHQSREAVDEGYNVLILSDRGVTAELAPIPALLAVSAVHQALVREGTRMQAGLVIETGEAREVHDFALLLGYGAAAINPWLAIDSVKELAATGGLEGVTEVREAKRRYIESINLGLLKIMSKMGISTLQSYRGAQIFEAVGLDRALIDRHFTGTPSRLGGVGLRELGREALVRHRRGFGPAARARGPLLPVGGEYQWRRRGELHKWNPATVAKLQHAARSGDPAQFAEYSALVDDEDRGLSTLRGQLERVPREPVPLDEVEPIESICRRFVTGAMSFGSISAEAHETLAIAMNRIGGKSNSGEGGEEVHRFEPDENGDWRRSAIKQVASARFGVTAHYLVNADDLQIKIAQGAKPGEGGQLPGHKVDERIAAVRHSTPGVTLISPPPHHDIYSIEDLAQLIYDLQTVNPASRVSVKLVSEVGVGTVAAGVAKAHAGAVVIAGASGGTGASPLSSIKRAGLPWELGIAEAQQVLVQNDLRGRVRLQVDGGLRTGRDLAVATLLGAEEWGVATAALIVEGCIMLRKCHLNTCSVGIATQRSDLRANFAGRADDVVRFFLMLAGDLRRIMASLGFRSIDEMVGRTDRLRPRQGRTGKAALLDLAPLLAQPDAPPERPRRCVHPVPWDLSSHLDHQIIERARASIDTGRRVEVALPIDNTKRAAGTMLSGLIARTRGAGGLPDDTISVKVTGSAGQSFGAFLVAGVTMTLEGDANDYVGKGLSGGRLVVKPPAGARFTPEDNIIVGNVVLYGATGGELFACGAAGERFAVRNSGARAVIEGLGDHGCEYMTGGVVVCLGRTGRNFAAGMSGGTAFVFDKSHRFRDLCNLEMVDLEPMITDSDIWLVYGLIEDHVSYTGSPLGRRILETWESSASKFVKVMPRDYKRVLESRRGRMRPSTAPPVHAGASGGFGGLGGHQ